MVFMSANKKNKNSASAQNTIVAFHREYSKYHYLYFPIGRNNGNKEIDKLILMVDQVTKHLL
jgi:hypothetical protein